MDWFYLFIYLLVDMYRFDMYWSFVNECCISLFLWECWIVWVFDEFWLMNLYVIVGFI